MLNRPAVRRLILLVFILNASLLALGLGNGDSIVAILLIAVFIGTTTAALIAYAVLRLTGRKLAPKSQPADQPRWYTGTPTFPGNRPSPIPPPTPAPESAKPTQAEPPPASTSTDPANLADTRPVRVESGPLSYHAPDLPTSQGQPALPQLISYESLFLPAEDDEDPDGLNDLLAALDTPQAVQPALPDSADKTGTEAVGGIPGGEDSALQATLPPPQSHPMLSPAGQKVEAPERDTGSDSGDSHGEVSEATRKSDEPTSENPPSEPTPPDLSEAQA